MLNADIDCAQLEAYFRENPGLTELSLSGATVLERLPELPETLEVLSLYDCPSLIDVPELLPEGLSSLVVEKCPGLTYFSHLPESLADLLIGDCPGLEPLLQWIRLTNLRNLEFRNCPGMRWLPAVPNSLLSLRVENCSALPGLPSLRNRLQSLEVVNCPQIQRLDRLPPSLTSLVLKQCPQLKGMVQLPESLQQLTVSECPSMVMLPLAAGPDFRLRGPVMMFQLSADRLRILLDASETGRDPLADASPSVLLFCEKLRLVLGPAVDTRYRWPQENVGAAAFAAPGDREWLYDAIFWEYHADLTPVLESAPPGFDVDEYLLRWMFDWVDLSTRMERDEEVVRRQPVHTA